MESVKNRRTIRRYSEREVEDVLLNRLLALSARTPTTGNMQLYSVVVTRSADKKVALAPAHFNQPMVKNAPVLLTVCADFNRFNKWCEQNKAIPGYGNLNSFMNAAMDALFFAQTFCVLAENEGLGTCYLGTTTYNPDQVIEVLGLPKFVFPMTTISLGYPEQLPEQPDRLELDAFVHQEQYEEYTSDTITQLYSRKESLPENKKFVEENKKETLAQVFTDIRYKKSDNEYFSQIILKTLKAQGFWGEESC